MNKYGLMVSPAGRNELDYINILSGGNRSLAGVCASLLYPASSNNIVDMYTTALAKTRLYPPNVYYPLVSSTPAQLRC